MATIDTSLGRLGVETRGEPGAPAILFLHGVGSDKRVWRPQLDHFGARGHFAVAFDYPGYGESAANPTATRDDFAAAIWAGADALGIGPAHVCGLSLGGVVALAMADQAPQRAASLVLADSFAIHPDGQGIYDRSVAASQAMTMRALAEARAAVLLGSAAPASLLAEVIDTMAVIDPAAYRVGAAAVWLADQRERARAIACPTLVLCGDEDSVTPPALSEALADLVPGAQLAMIARSGHLANAEQPEAFNRAVEEFLSTIE